MEYFALAREEDGARERSWSEQYRLDLPAVCRGFLVKMSVFRVRTCAKVYELLYNISFRDNADISDIYIYIVASISCALLHGTFDVVRSFCISSLHLYVYDPIYATEKKKGNKNIPSLGFSCKICTVRAYFANR